LTHEQVAAIELLMQERAQHVLAMAEAPAALTRGKILLMNGQTMDGTWAVYKNANVVDFFDNTGVEWWFDINLVIGFSPQPAPAP